MIQQNLKLKKFTHYFIYILFLTIILFFVLQSKSYAADPKLITTLNKAFSKIEDWLIKLATPAAAIAVCSGIFIKKFSFGDEERIRTGKNLIRNSLFSYTFILAIDSILSAIDSLI